MSNRERQKIIQYLAKFSVTYGVESEELLNCIVESWHKGKSNCRSLLVKCRERTQDSSMFLFTRNKEVVAQFPIPTKILQRSNISLINYYIENMLK